MAAKMDKEAATKYGRDKGSAKADAALRKANADNVAKQTADAGGEGGSEGGGDGA